jgi:hypothetical protein
MTDDRYIPRMSRDRRGAIRFGAVAVGVVFAVASVAGCGGDGSSDDTLSPLDPTAGTAAAGVTATGDVAPSAQTAVDPMQAGSGFVSIQVRLPAVGVDETISLDRATVRADALDPVSLDATCTPLDGGEGLTVSVVDLRRLGAGARLVSAALRVEGDPTAGPHDVTLDVSGADQVTTQYTGTIELAEGSGSGTFEVTDDSGAVASGSFVCAEQAIVTTTTAAPAGGGEEVPGSEPPPTGG